MGAGAGRRMTPNPIMLLGSLAAAPGSPRIVQSPLELDGYLTGIIVTPKRHRSGCTGGSPAYGAKTSRSSTTPR
jgi:hypothetical protein